MTFHIFYTITLQAGCKFSLSMQIFGLHSPSRCLLLFLYMFLKLSLPLNKNIFGIFSALKQFQGWSFIVFIKRKTRSKYIMMIILYLLVYTGKFSEMGRELKSLWIFLLNQGIISSSTSPCRHVFRAPC